MSNKKTYFLIILFTMLAAFAYCQKKCGECTQGEIGGYPVWTSGCGSERSALQFTATNYTNNTIDIQVCMETNDASRIRMGIRWDCNMDWGIKPGKSVTFTTCWPTGKILKYCRIANGGEEFPNPNKMGQ
jgi:hypothetical protein